jgi:hypothetical protein
MPQPGLFASIGYHVLMRLDGWEDTIRTTLDTALEGAELARKSHHAFLTKETADGHTFNQASGGYCWKHDGSGEKLTDIASKARDIVATVQSERVTPAADGLSVPELALDRCTFADPWFQLFSTDSAFEASEKEADALYEAQPTEHKTKENEQFFGREQMLAAVLLSEMGEKLEMMNKVAREDIQDALLGQFSMAHAEWGPEDGAPPPIAEIKKRVFFLRFAIDWDDRSSVEIACESVVAGTAGRCADGQNSFYDAWASQNKFLIALEGAAAAAAAAAASASCKSKEDSGTFATISQPFRVKLSADASEDALTELFVAKLDLLTTIAGYRTPAIDLLEGAMRFLQELCRHDDLTNHVAKSLGVYSKLLMLDEEDDMLLFWHPEDGGYELPEAVKVENILGLCTVLYKLRQERTRKALADAGDKQYAPGEAGVIMSMQVQVGAFMQDLRQTFVRMHGSRLPDGHESRTVTHLLLSQMLRLPMSLAGDYSQVLYPDYVTDHLMGGPETMTIEAIMRRFLNGGTLVHRDDGVSHTTEFPPFTLAFVGRLARQHIVRGDLPLPWEGHGKNWTSFRSGTEAREEGVHPIPQMEARISEETLIGRESSLDEQAGMQKLEGFMAKDAVLSSAWAHFVGSNKSESNRFFLRFEDCVDKVTEFGEDQGTFNIGLHMTDAAIVRLLDVAGYIDFTNGGRMERSKSGQDPASSFYTKVPRGWTFEPA